MSKVLIKVNIWEIAAINNQLQLWLKLKWMQTDYLKVTFI